MQTIRLSYRKIIDTDSKKPWDRAVFDDTHMEFYMQAQRLDPEGKFRTFLELSDNVVNAEQLHYATSTAAIGYIRQLKDITPDVANVSGKLCLPFKNFRFEIVQSHMEDKTQHKVAIWFYSEPLTWIDTVNDRLLIAYGNQSESLMMGREVETDMIAMVPYLSISHFISNGLQS